MPSPVSSRLRSKPSAATGHLWLTRALDTGRTIWRFLSPLTLALCLFSPQAAQAQVSLPNGTVEAPAVDLRVKVLGGQVTLDRQWSEGNWRPNLRWAPSVLLMP